MCCNFSRAFISNHTWQQHLRALSSTRYFGAGLWRGEHRSLVHPGRRVAAASSTSGSEDTPPGRVTNRQRKRILLALKEREKYGKPRSTVPIDWTAEEGECGRNNYKAVVAYDGTNYCGFQLQKGKPREPTVQLALEKALCGVLRQGRGTLMLQGASRTDAGVHAKGQVINFFTDRAPAQCLDLQRAVNARLPDAICVKEIVPVPTDFNARFSTLSKTYHFFVHTSPLHDPFSYRFRQHTWYPLDLPATRAAAQLFVGQHDFTQFSNVNPDGSVRDPNKSIFRFDMVEIEDGLRFEITGSGFLYKQVRHMVSVLLWVGRGLMSAERVSELLARGSSGGLDPTRHWQVADAKGLFLMEVNYPPHDDPTRLIYPDLPHDSYGRVWLPSPDSGNLED